MKQTTLWTYTEKGKTKMIYTTLDSIVALCENFDGLSKEDKAYVSAMLKTYWQAYHNPPPGIIGVGAVTYAEQKLIDFQLSNVGGR